MTPSEFPALPGRQSPGYVIVALPDEIDLLNAYTVSDSLLTELNRGAAGVIADMTRTRFCDAAGCRAVARASSRARLLGTWVRAVIPDPFVRRIFMITGADQFVPVRISLDDALTGGKGLHGQAPPGRTRGDPVFRV